MSNLPEIGRRISVLDARVTALEAEREYTAPGCGAAGDPQTVCERASSACESGRESPGGHSLKGCDYSEAGG